MKDKRYILNTKTGTLHKVNGCYHSNVWENIAKHYDTEDEAIADQTRYFRYCKNCFKNEK